GRPAEPSRGRADQEAAEASARRRSDLVVKPVHDRADRSLERLQGDVAGEAIGDDHVGGLRQQVAPLGVAAEVELTPGEQRVRLQAQLVALLRLLADRAQTTFRILTPEELIREDRAHVAE